MTKKINYLALFLFLSSSILAQSADSTSSAVAKDTVELSKFDQTNLKMEKLFKKIPVPLVAYSSDAGSVFGFAKFNTFHLNKNDTLSGFSKISEVFTMSTKGRINASVAPTMVFNKDRFIVKGFINFRKQPEFILGIGNDVSVDDVEEISITRLKLVNLFLYNVVSDLFVGVGVDINNTFSVEKDSNSFLDVEDYPGKDGGFATGFGGAAVWDTRDNRYNSSKGSFMSFKFTQYWNIAGNGFDFAKFELDLRKYFNPWYKHVIALQVATNHCYGDVPYYELSMLGGENRMRGYYQGALRDKTLLDGQIEYRMPVWKMFGVTGWVGTGRVADKYSNMAFDGFWFNYGVGLRIKVDSESNTNMRMDFGFGPDGINGFYLNFSEAF